MTLATQDHADSLQLCYRLLFERNPLPMCVYDARTWRVLTVNDAAISQYGYSMQEFTQHTLLDLHLEDDLTAVREQLQRPLGEHPTTQLWRHRRRDGSPFEVETLTQAVETKGMHLHMVLIRDLTEQRRLEQAQRVLTERLAEERDTLAAVVNSTRDAIIATDAEGHVLSFNPGAEHIFGRAAPSMQGRPVEVLLPERFRAAHPKLREQFAEAGVHSRMMGLGLVKGLRADGQELDLEATISKVMVQQQPRLMVNLRDVTARVRADAEVEQSRRQLSDLTQKLMSQEKVLVKRLALALHDQVGQTMAAVRMAHETSVAMQAGRVSPEMDRLQAQLGVLIGQAIRQIRQVLIDLRPPLLEENGLASALDNELRNRSLTLPKVDFSIQVRPDVATMRWPSDVEYAAFMVAREAIENACRHSGSTSVEVSLSGSHRALDMEVTDAGSGIPEGAKRRTGRLGILGMQERAHAIGATVMIDSSASQGTRMCFRWRGAP